MKAYTLDLIATFTLPILLAMLVMASGGWFIGFLPIFIILLRVRKLVKEVIKEEVKNYEPRNQWPSDKKVVVEEAS